MAAPAGTASKVDTRADSRADVRVDDPGTDTGARERREIRFPTIPALAAVLLVGAVVGLAAVLLTWGSLRLCDVATGTASCGGGPGLLLLVAILIALTYLGGWLLRGFGISDAGSTSFLAVGLLAVVAMLFLVDSLDEWSRRGGRPGRHRRRLRAVVAGHRGPGRRGRRPAVAALSERRRAARRSARC